MTPQLTPQLTLGPVLFNWDPEVWRDFYFRIADEADVDTVCVGEVVCSKRSPFFAPYLAEVTDRLRAGGKEVVLSSLALIMNNREMNSMRELVAGDGNGSDFQIEANDISVAALLTGKAHSIGPLVNIFNEGTLGFLSRRGAQRVCLPTELSGQTISVLQDYSTDLDTELEVMVFGRMPLAISARCYHARNAGLHKDNCRFVCAEDADGLEVETLDGESFLAINGLQTLSASYLSLAAEIPALMEMGVRRFRLSPHTVDMVSVAALFRALTKSEIDAEEASARVATLCGDVSTCNGYFHDLSGCHQAMAAAE